MPRFFNRNRRVRNNQFRIMLMMAMTYWTMRSDVPYSEILLALLLNVLSLYSLRDLNLPEEQLILVAANILEAYRIFGEQELTHSTLPWPTQVFALIVIAVILFNEGIFPVLDLPPIPDQRLE